MKKSITILGATGMVGRNLLRKAIINGNKIKVLVRNREKLQEFNNAIEIVEGNYFDKDKLKNALEGSEAILSTIGPPMNSKLSLDDEENYINSLAFIINLMNKNKQTRLINISGAGVKIAHENLPLARKLIRVSQMAASKSTINIKDRELQLIEQSKLDWTCIRPPIIKEDIEGEFVVDENKFLGTTVDLNQLTDFMITEITSNNWVKKAPVIGTR